MNRRGFKTTEFYTSLATVIFDLVTSVPVHDKKLVSIIAGAFALARGLGKLGAPDIPLTDYTVPPENSSDRPENR